jgi:hypothetical protein
LREERVDGCVRVAARELIEQLLAIVHQARASLVD